MRHDWTDGPYKHKFEGMSTTRRTCKLCGKVQELVVEQTWGRVTGRKWTPLVGRCTGKS